MRLYRKISLVLAILTGVFIFYISSLSFPPSPFPTLSIIPILYHFGIFLLFALFVLASLNNEKYWFFSLIFSGIYAALDEVHQYYVPGRNCNFLDFGIDFAGCFVGILLFLSFCRIFNPKN